MDRKVEIKMGGVNYIYNFLQKDFFSIKPLYFDQNSLDCKFENNFLVCLLFR
jgi:hypothetical protein